MTTTYHVHPGIGIARLGNSPTDFCITPETAGGLPIACDESGNALLTPDGKSEVPVEKFKDEAGRVKRQAARFYVCEHNEEHPEGRPLKIGDRVEGGGNFGTLVDVQWRVYLANKKAAWYEFKQLEGEHGYAPDHPRRNAGVVEASARQRLIIDPGPQSVDLTSRRRASFARGANPFYAQSFPPPLSPHSVDTLGDLLTDGQGRLLVLGGHGCAGSAKRGPDDPIITHYANNDGWFDDTSDGPVMARLKFFVEDIQRHRFIDVAAPSWVIVGYPGYVPTIFDMVTLDDVVFDLGVRELATRTDLFGAPPFDPPRQVDSADPEALAWWKTQELRYNTGYHPWFYRDVWPILSRPYNFTWLTRVLYGSNFPHDVTERGTFFKERLSRPPRGGEDPNRGAREYLFHVLRLPGEENELKDLGRPDSRTHNVPLMPLLAGDNPISNVHVSKFLRLTDTQLFVLKQWAAGKFVNEREEWPDSPPVGNETAGPAKTGHALDRAVLANVLGGAFCPGGEVGWSVRNPSIYLEPYRIKGNPTFYDFGQTSANAYYKPALDFAYYSDTQLSQDDDLAAGLEPGDLTKHMALPWQADFNECSYQEIDVTYEDWNEIYPGNPRDPSMKRKQAVWQTLWWPAHRPLQVFVVTSVADGKASYDFVDWAKGIPQTDAGDLKMVTSWADLGFVVRNPYFQGNPSVPPKPWEDPGSNPLYVAVEINEPAASGGVTRPDVYKSGTS
jgi:hypothetical protein